MADLNDLPSCTAIVGMAKNCGKTTTLNALSATFHAAGETVGLVSIGIDGEASDVLIGTPKPPVHVAPGQLIVTADAALDASGISFEWLESLGVRTPLGETVMARALEVGEVVLGGLRHRSDVRRAVELLGEAGASRTFVDGAYGRITAASPELTEATIVSTGAVVSDDPAELAALTLELLDRLTLPRAETTALRELASAAAERDRPLIDDPSGEPRELPSSSALLGLQRGRDLWEDHHDTLAIPGLVSDGVIEELLALGRSGHLVLDNPTALQCSGRLFRRLRARWNVVAVETIDVFGVSLNPTSIRGGSVDAVEVARRIAAARPNLTVFNPLLGLHSLV